MAGRDAQVDALMQRFQSVNNFYIAKIAKQIAKIGKLSQSSVNRLVIMAEMNEDIAAINLKLANTLQITRKGLYDLYEDVLNETYTDPRFRRALKETPLPEAAKRRLQHYARVVSLQTAGTLQNLSNTTLVSQTYRQVVDEAILAVSSGLGDYKAATRSAVRRLGYNGLQMRYPTGYHRRLDTALRQNIVDGVNQIAQNGSIMIGDELGYDAYEISAHARSAPDHEPIQGHVFLKAEFEKMQSEQPFADADGRRYKAIRRPIGEWNCMHIAMSFSTEYSVRRYSDKQLDKWIRENGKGCMIGGKYYTIYAASQLMRQIETQVRREKDAANAARIVGDDELRKECQIRINALARKYEGIAKASGLMMRKDRMRVEGFKMVKV